VKLTDLFPKNISEEMDSVVLHIRKIVPFFDESDPWSQVAVALCWCVGEIVRLRERDDKRPIPE